MNTSPKRATSRSVAANRDAEHGLAAVAGDRAEAQGRALRHACHVADRHRHAAVLGDDDAFDVAGAAHQAQAAHQVLLPAQVHVLAAHLAVVGGQRLHDVLEAEAVLDELLRIDEHL